MYTDKLIGRLLRSYDSVPVNDDRSDVFIDNFIEWTKELKNEIYLFGHCKAAEKLVAKFPGVYRAIVDLDPAKQGKKVKGVSIISFEDYKRIKADKIIITDINFQYVYLDLLYYDILHPLGLVSVDGLWNFKIRYNYELKRIAYGYNPEIFDYEYLNIKRSLVSSPFLVEIR